MKIALTGGSGKAGRVVFDDLLERGHEVLNVNRRPLARVVLARLSGAAPGFVAAYA